MNPTTSERDPVERLAEDFLERVRRGERPDIAAIIDAHPELAEQIQDLFPAIAFLEQMGGAKEAKAPVPTPPPEYLGEYRLLREIGRGGMGVVYEAVQESLGRHVALKVLPFSRLVSPMHLERFQREARAAARLHHSNIVPVFGVGQHTGLHFYAMQVIHGQATLQRYARSDDDGAISIRGVATDREILSLPGTGLGAWSLRFSPNGRFLAAGHQRKYQPKPKYFKVWDWQRRETLVEVHLEDNWREVDFSPDSRWLAIGKETAAVTLYDLASDKKEAKDLAMEVFPAYVAFCPEGRTLAVAQPRGVKVIDLATEEVLATLPHQNEVRGMAWSGDGKLLATLSGSLIYLWDSTSYRQLAILRGHERNVTDVAFNHHGDLLVSRSDDSPDGQWVATGPWFGSGVRIWDAASGALRQELPLSGSAAVAFNPEGTRLLVCTGNGYSFLELGTWQQRQQVGKEPENATGEVAFSRDGSQLAVRSSTRQLCLVDPANSQTLAELQTPGQQSLAWHCLSPDGCRLAACSGGVISIWDLRAIRGQLAARGLDWEPPLDPEEGPSAAPPLLPFRVELNAGHPEGLPPQEPKR